MSAQPAFRPGSPVRPSRAVARFRQAQDEQGHQHGHAASTHGSHAWLRTSQIDAVIDGTISTVAVSLARRGTVRSRSQRAIAGPSRGRDNNQRCQRGDARDQQAAVSSRNGTVGSKGNTMPTTASTNDSAPATISTQRTMRARRGSSAAGRGADKKRTREKGLADSNACR